MGQARKGPTRQMAIFLNNVIEKTRCLIVNGTPITFDQFERDRVAAILLSCMIEIGDDRTVLPSFNPFIKERTISNGQGPPLRNIR